MMDYEESEDVLQEREELHPFVIGSTLLQKNGETVACWGKVSNISPNGDAFTIQTADDQDVTIRMKSPISEPLDSWVEVHGTAQGKTISCKELVRLPSDVDAEEHKALVQFLTALEDPFGMNHLSGDTKME